MRTVGRVNTYLGERRFVVRELEGYAKVAVGGGMTTGLCVTVIDRAYCCAIVGEYHSEDVSPGGRAKVTRDDIRAKIRRLAAERCAELNARA